MKLDVPTLFGIDLVNCCLQIGLDLIFAVHLLLGNLFVFDIKKTWLMFFYQLKIFEKQFFILYQEINVT